MTKTIFLTRGLKTIVDDDWYEKLIAHKWYAQGTEATGFYAVRAATPEERGTGRLRGNVRMHRYIIGVDSMFPLMIDHINGDSLDNRVANLRAADASQNQHNRRGAQR